MIQIRKIALPCGARAIGNQNCSKLTVLKVCFASGKKHVTDTGVRDGFGRRGGLEESSKGCFFWRGRDFVLCEMDV